MKYFRFRDKIFFKGMKKEKGYVYFLGKICYDKYDNAEKQEGKR